MSTRVLIVGAGHAGLEAAYAAARVLGSELVRVVVVTGRLDTVGQTPCNPSVGGVAKGHLVAEIGALGGWMGQFADATAIHGRVLNLSKGPAVQATRLQVDKARYGAVAQGALLGHPGIEAIEGLVESVVIEGGRARGVLLVDGRRVDADAVVVTTGTFLGGLLHVGKQKTPGGRVGEPPAKGLSKQLASLGFALSRLKTGTPPRLDRKTIAYDALEAQGSDEPFPRFCPTGENHLGGSPGRVHCHITYTNPATHAIVEEHLLESPMYSGQIDGTGPRYCPALEDKIVRFKGRDRHQVFLEPEGLDTDSVYPNGISTSLPAEVQSKFVATIPGLEKAEIIRPGYAVEYDAVDARGLTHALGAKDIEGLYFAGQINGTSGYEEAGIQGLLAGANAALWLEGKPMLVLGRDQGYGGVLVDDLVTQGCDEPYRMFTSRAEYRIVLREDNAEERLSALAHASGLLDDARWARVQARLEAIDALEAHIRAGATADDLSKAHDPRLVRSAHSRVVYSGYLERQRREIERMHGHGAQDLPLPTDLDYRTLPGLSYECAERLSRVRPVSTAQAARIPGMTPAALMCLWAHARNLNRGSVST